MPIFVLHYQGGPAVARQCPSGLPCGVYQKAIAWHQISKNANGQRRIQFYDGNGKRRSIGISSISERKAERIRDKVEQLVEQTVTGTPLSSEVSRWVAGLDDRMHAKLAKVGLTDNWEPTEVASATECITGDIRPIEFFDQYLVQCGDLKPSSLTVYGNVRRNFIEFFDDGKALAAITEFDADNFRRFMKSKGYADATVNRRCGVAKTVAKAAVRHRLIQSNPFEHLAATVNGNPQKRRMISREISVPFWKPAHQPSGVCLLCSGDSVECEFLLSRCVSAGVTSTGQIRRSTFVSQRMSITTVRRRERSHCFRNWSGLCWMFRSNQVVVARNS